MGPANSGEAYMQDPQQGSHLKICPPFLKSSVLQRGEKPADHALNLHDPQGNEKSSFVVTHCLQNINLLVYGNNINMY